MNMIISREELVQIISITLSLPGSQSIDNLHKMGVFVDLEEECVVGGKITNFTGMIGILSLCDLGSYKNLVRTSEGDLESVVNIITDDILGKNKQIELSTNIF